MRRFACLEAVPQLLDASPAVVRTRCAPFVLAPLAGEVDRAAKRRGALLQASRRRRETPPPPFGHLPRETGEDNIEGSAPSE
jgi:hypothetical protein